MLKLEDIRKDAALSGIEPDQIVRVVTTEPVGDHALTVYYRTADGKLAERMLFRTDEPKLSWPKPDARGLLMHQVISSSSDLKLIASNSPIFSIR